MDRWVLASNASVKIPLHLNPMLQSKPMHRNGGSHSYMCWKLTLDRNTREFMVSIINIINNGIEDPTARGHQHCDTHQTIDIWRVLYLAWGGIFVCPGYDLSITLFISITMSYGIDIILWNILVFGLNVRIFCQILSIPRNIVMDLNNVMS